MAGIQQRPPAKPKSYGFVKVKPKPNAGQMKQAAFGVPYKSTPYKAPPVAKPPAPPTNPFVNPARSPMRPLVDTGGGSLIQGDWEVQEAETNLASMMARMRGDFQGGLRQAYIDWGGSGDTAQLGALGQYIDADTIKKAVENKYSSTAQTAQQLSKAQAMANARRAGQGNLFSGGTTSEQERLVGQAEGVRYQNLRDFLSGGQQGLSSLADAEAQGAREIAQARFAAAARAADQYPGAFLGAGEDMGTYGNQQTSLAGVVKPLLGGARAPARPTLLSQRAWLAKNPRGNYANYVRAFQRQAAQRR